MNELISVIIPVYNSARYLPDTIRSLQEQTYTCFEAIFVDDASSDNSSEIIESVKDERFRLIRLESNHGPAHARNQGINAAKSNYLAFLDADDLWYEEKLEKQLEFMQEKNCGFSFTGYQFMDETLTKPGAVVRVPEMMDYSSALKNTTIFITTVMLNLEKLLGISECKRTGLFRVDAAREDTQAWWDILRTGVTAYGIDENLAYYRRYNQSSSANKLAAIAGTWSMYRNIEKLSVAKTLGCFIPYLFNAVKRRI